MNILDVWFDSGSSHEAVLSVRPELTWPADMYLEGSDQHRGWFQSSLLVGLGTRGRAPFREVLTHGFSSTSKAGRCPSRVGNVDPAAGRHQAERRRRPAAVGVVERLPRRDPREPGNPRARRRGLPQDPQHVPLPASRTSTTSSRRHARRAGRAAARRRSVHARPIRAPRAKRVRTHYDDYDFQAIFQAINEFVTVDLSAFYLDVVEGPALHVRRRLARAPVRADGPVPHRRRPRAAARADSVDDDGRSVAVPAGRARDIRAPRGISGRRGRWRTERTRAGVGRACSKSAASSTRRSKKRGSAKTSAARSAREVTIAASGADADLLAAHEADLPMFFIVSAVDPHAGAAADREGAVPWPVS